MKFRSSLISLSLISLLLAGYFFLKWDHTRKENNRLSNNFEALSEQIQELSKEQSKVLSMTKAEIKQTFPVLEERLKKDFDVKLKNLIQYTRITAEVNSGFKAPVIDWDHLSRTADSVLLSLSDRYQIDTIQVKSFSFSDAWTDFKAVEIMDTVYVERNKSIVPLEQVIHREKWKLKNLFKPRQLIQNIKTPNPNAHIDFNQTIIVSK